MKHYKIFTKLFLSHTAIGFVSAVGFSFIFYFILKDALIERTVDQLSSINILKKNMLENYLSTSQKNLGFLFDHEYFLTQSNYGFDRSGLPDLHQKHSIETELQSIQQLYHFTTVTITDTLGHSLYTTSGDTLFLKHLGNNTLFTKGVDQFLVVDASDIAVSRLTELVYVFPIRRQTKLAGYIIIKEDFQKIENLLRENTGVGNTGESYLVGNDLRMRSSSRFFPDRSPLSIAVETDAIRNTFNDVTSDHILRDYRGVNVLSTYRKISTPTLNWAIVTEIDFSEAMKPVIQLRNYLIVIALLVFLIITVVTLLISNAISKPILQLTDSIVTLSKGIIPEKKKEKSGQDEIGLITQAINQLIDGLGRTTEFANEIGSGNFNVAYTTLGDKDTLGLALVSMRDKLKMFNEREVRLVREKAAALLEGQENERKRIIQELHDGVGQLLTAIRIRVEMLESKDEAAGEIGTLINETIAEVKRISYNVMPNAIVDFGLEAALRGLCENVKKYSSLKIDFQYVKEIKQELNFEISIAVFRIVQEGFNNIVKHAEATQVDLHVLEKEDEIYFVLRDNGKGFSEEDVAGKNGFGLRGIKERAMFREGKAEILTAQGEGTMIEVHIPIV